MDSMDTSRLPPRRQASGRPPSSEQKRTARLADRLHSASIHLLRRLRVHDAGTGLTSSRLSALSVVVHAGPLRMSDLAAAEQVRPPTISRLVGDLEAEGLVRRTADPGDGRVQRVEATAAGRRLLEAGRARRVEALASRIEALAAEEQSTLEAAADILERLALPDDHPRREG